MSPLHDFSSLPVVDASGLFGGEGEQRASPPSWVGPPARSGFLYVTGSGVPQEYFEACWRAQGFFALPLEEKMKVYIGNSSNHRGYVPTGEEGDTPDRRRKPDLKEAFDSASSSRPTTLTTSPATRC